MKPRTYFGIALLFPYFLWIIFVMITYPLLGQDVSESWNFVLMPIVYYVIGAILWFIPYTFLAIGMWFWSKGKTKNAARKMVIAAPFLLFVLMLIEAVLVSFPVNSIKELTDYLLGMSVLFGVSSLIFGYFCVGIALGVYKFLQKKNIITEDIQVLLPEI